jgi:hypothetical protein
MNRIAKFGDPDPCPVCNTPGCPRDRHAGTAFGQLECDYAGVPPFPDNGWCPWCAGTGHPFMDESYGFCSCTHTSHRPGILHAATATAFGQKECDCVIHGHCKAIFVCEHIAALREKSECRVGIRNPLTGNEYELCPQCCRMFWTLVAQARFSVVCVPCAKEGLEHVPQYDWESDPLNLQSALRYREN